MRDFNPDPNFNPYTAYSSPEDFEQKINSWLSWANGHYPVLLATGDIDPNGDEYGFYRFTHDNQKKLIRDAYEGRSRFFSSPQPIVTKNQIQNTEWQMPFWMRLCFAGFGFCVLGTMSAAGFWSVAIILGIIWLLIDRSQRKTQRHRSIEAERNLMREAKIQRNTVRRPIEEAAPKRRSSPLDLG